MPKRLMLFDQFFSFSICACPAPDEDPGNNPPAASYAEIAGEYYLDAADLGMPMAWYVKVTADGNFTIATARTYADNTIKGKGTVGKSADCSTYMFLYEDSTTEKPKTATFTVVDKNLVFSTSVPVGAASVSPNTEGDVTTYPTAKIIGAEEILGTYIGEYDKTTGMGSVLYSYELTLGYGYTYTFESSFAMMGNTYTRTETGKFTVDGANLTFTADAEGATPVSGTLENYVLAGDELKFKIESVAPAAKMTFYADTVQGVFKATAAGEGEGAAEYAAILILIGDQFRLTVGQMGATTPDPNYSITRTFTVAKAMGAVTITLTSESDNAALATITAAVSANGINAELIFDLEDTAKLGFQFAQDMALLEFLQTSISTTPAPENPMG